MTTEETKAAASPNRVEGEEQLKRSKKQKKKKTDSDCGEENGNLGTDRNSKKKKSKKRTASDLDSREVHVNAEVNHEVDGEYDMNEPTMEEKLASLGLVDDDKSKSITKLEPSPVPVTPSADSVHLLLKQALHADDHALLLDCLYSRDEKGSELVSQLTGMSHQLTETKAKLEHRFAAHARLKETYIRLSGLCQPKLTDLTFPIHLN